jgi:hypothetical protein
MSSFEREKASQYLKILLEDRYCVRDRSELTRDFVGRGGFSVDLKDLQKQKENASNQNKQRTWMSKGGFQFLEAILFVF